jgi:hypothetical protein
MSEELLYKSEGVKDCVKWLEKEIKSGKSLTAIDIKISLEKYMKKLKHQYVKEKSLLEDWDY